MIGGPDKDYRQVLVLVVVEYINLVITQYVCYCGKISLKIFQYNICLYVP